MSWNAWIFIFNYTVFGRFHRSPRFPAWFALFEGVASHHFVPVHRFYNLCVAGVALGRGFSFFVLSVTILAPNLSTVFCAVVELTKSCLERVFAKIAKLENLLELV